MRLSSMLLLSGAVLAAGCATVTRGTNDVLEIQSNVPATAKLSTGQVCETPCAVKLPRKSEVAVAVSAPGYKTAQATVTNKVAGGGAAGMAGNVLVGGIIGAGVDVATGAMLELVPNPLVVTLVPTGGVTASASGQSPALTN